jgi:hypothetical protein
MANREKKAALHKTICKAAFLLGSMPFLINPAHQRQNISSTDKTK